MDSIQLEENFKLFYRIAKILILELRDDDKVLAAQWLRKLAACNSPGDKELRNHYMTLMLIVLQQKRIVGPFKTAPVGGNILEPFVQDFQPADIQRLIKEELDKVPPPPLLQFALSGGPRLTEFAVTQEIPKFGVHFYYVCSIEPIADFQQRHRSKIPRALMGPTRSTMRDLNAGIEQLLRSEKQKLKVTVDKSGKKKIQIRDENFAEFAGQAKKSRMSKRLQQRLGVRLPDPEPGDDYEEERSPRRPQQPSAPIITITEADVATAVAAGAAAATAATPRAAAKAKSAGRVPAKAHGRTAKQVAQPTRTKSPVVYSRTPLRFEPHPGALPTPPLFIPGAYTQGLVYEPEYFGLEPTTQFAYPQRKFLETRWSPSKRGERVQVRDIIKEHPITEEIQQIQADVRPRIDTTPELMEEIREIQRRAQLIEGADVRTRLLMEKFYAAKAAKPRALDFSLVDEGPTSPTRAKGGLAVEDHGFEEMFQPVLLDDRPIDQMDMDELIDEEEITYGDLFGGTKYYLPPRPRTSHGSPGQLNVPEEYLEDEAEYVEQEGFLSDEDMEFMDEFSDYESPMQSPHLTLPSTPPTPMSAGGRLEEARRAYRETMGLSSPRAPPTPHTPSKPDENRLIDVSGDVPAFSPGTPRSTATMMDLIIMGTPERMAAKMTSIMDQINQQVAAHNNLIGTVSELPRSASIDNLVTEFTRGNHALETLRSRLSHIQIVHAVKPQTPPRAEMDTEDLETVISPIGITLQLQDLSEVIETTMESAHILQDVAESVPESIVQQAAEQSLDSTDALLEISDRMAHLTTIWEETMKGLDDSSFGLIDDEAIEDNIFGGAAEHSPAQGTVDRMVEDLNTSVKEVIAEGGAPDSPAAVNLKSKMRDFQQALQDISFQSSLLEGSFPEDDMLDEAVDELEQSIQSETAAIASVSRTPEKLKLLEKSEAIVEGLNDVLDQMLAIQPVEPSVLTALTPKRRALASRLNMLRIASRRGVEEAELVEFDEEQSFEVPNIQPFTIDWPDDREILDEDEMAMDDLLMDAEREDVRRSIVRQRASARRVVFQAEDGDILPENRQILDNLVGETGLVVDVQREVLDLLTNTKQQQEALLNASLAVQANAIDASAVAACQQVTQRIIDAQGAVDEMISRAQMSGSPLRVDDQGFGWMGPMVRQPKLKKVPQKTPLIRSQSSAELKVGPKPISKTPRKTLALKKPPSKVRVDEHQVPVGIRGGGGIRPMPTVKPAPKIVQSTVHVDEFQDTGRLHEAILTTPAEIARKKAAQAVLAARKKASQKDLPAAHADDFQDRGRLYEAKLTTPAEIARKKAVQVALAARKKASQKAQPTAPAEMARKQAARQKALQKNQPPVHVDEFQQVGRLFEAKLTTPGEIARKKAAQEARKMLPRPSSAAGTSRKR